MLRAVGYLHSHRIVHRDIKLENFVYESEDPASHLKLIDFGIAKRIASETTNISRDATVGTISYMAPEAVRHGAIKLGRPSDIWSLGIILYQMAYRRSPFAHLEPMQRLFALSDPDVDVEFPPGHRLEHHTPETQALLVDVLKRCLQRDPSQRASIPQLLEHHFLKDDVRLARASFDRTMEALVAGFCAAAKEVLCGEEADAAGEELLRGSWQWLSDEVWEQLLRAPATGSKGRGVLAERPALGGAADFAGFRPLQEHLQRWVARGGAKRQRAGALPSQAPSNLSAEEAPADEPSPAGAVALPPPPPAPPATAQAPMPRGPPAPPPRRQPLAHAPPSAADSAKPAKVPGAARGAGPAMSIQAELLQKQRSILRKAVPAPGKENKSGPCRGGGKTREEAVPESLVLRRLRDRCALAENQQADDEHTEHTGWTHQ
uniref:Protein kinase domain-containing protein n=1 Tax=Pyrodinium bahamense TaxID=73915 RepID=A0A7S0AJ85_9DINO|mmetsp:Transcript_34873/g.96429  ORF Transcript_34873/g.96429 Transcript_34873/m.96429 type:complete len:433 (+) Transcript_34873:2-1300(+)